VGPNGIYTKIFKWKNNKKRKTQIMANWIRSKFNCTAELQHYSPEPDQQSSPCKLRFCETECIEKDQESLCKFCQIHKCNDYCMRKPNDDKESKELSQTKPKINKVSPITM
jgi:hypothetical protein